MTRVEKLAIVATIALVTVALSAFLWTNQSVARAMRDGPTRAEEPASEAVEPPARAAPPPPAERVVSPPPPAAPPVDTTAQNQPEPTPVIEAVAEPAPPPPAVEPKPEVESQRAEALRSLHAVEAQLAAGNTDGVDAALEAASEALDEPARISLSSAREALENKDLTMARQYLADAIATTSRR